MRFVVLLFAILGTASTGFLGWKWYTDYKMQMSKPENQLMVQMIEANKKLDAKLEVVWNDLEMLRGATYALLGSAILAIIGGMMALDRRRWAAAFLLLVVGAGPALFIQDTLLFTSPLILAGLLSMRIAPPMPKSSSDEEEEEDAEPPPKRSGLLSFAIFLVCVGLVGAMNWQIIESIKANKSHPVVDPLGKYISAMGIKKAS